MTTHTGNGLIDGKPALSSAATTVAAAAALTVLTTIAGFQLIRLFIPTLVWYLGDTLGLNIFARAGIGALVFLASFLAWPLQRLLGLRGALILAAGGALLLRLGAQLFTAPPVTLLLSMTGAALFLIFLPLALGAARHHGPARVASFAVALFAGVAADTALHIAAGTYDLGWQSGLLPLLATVFVVAAGLVSLALLLPGLPERPAAVPWSRAWPLLAFGPWLVLQLTIFQNIARLAALTGWSLPAAALLLTTANILALFAAARLGAGWPRWGALLAGVALVAILIPGRPAPLPAALLTVAGSLLAALLIVRAFSASAAATGAAGLGAAGLGRSTVAFSLGALLFVLLFFAHNAPNNLALPFTAEAVVPVMALFLAVPAGLAPANAARPLWRTPLLAAFAALLLLAPAALAIGWQTPQPVAPGEGATLRFLQYNLHNGFNTDGRLDMEAIAAAIEDTGAGVVTLQEVSRGWVVNGSLDMASWLSQRLNMTYVAGPTSPDGLWGNAILSRYPIVATGSGALPSEGVPLKRGYVYADVDTGGASVRAIATHLHQVLEDSDRRQQQIPPLLAARGAGPVIIAGDFNAWPEFPEMQMLAQAGLVDAVASLTSDPAYTSPADEPYQRIDYVWLSPPLQAQSYAMPPTLASDHLPIFVEVALPAR
jgi:endonuclease/exonuclease/phosphatase family metal-dependent hydrolase